jgi:hypothetical protein
MLIGFMPTASTMKSPRLCGRESVPGADFGPLARITVNVVAFCLGETELTCQLCGAGKQSYMARVLSKVSARSSRCLLWRWLPANCTVRICSMRPLSFFVLVGIRKATNLWFVFGSRWPKRENIRNHSGHLQTLTQGGHGFPRACVLVSASCGMILKTMLHCVLRFFGGLFCAPPVFD